MQERFPRSCDRSHAGMPTKDAAVAQVSLVGSPMGGAFDPSLGVFSSGSSPMPPHSSPIPYAAMLPCDDLKRSAGSEASRPPRTVRMPLNRVLVFGNGGHARVVVDAMDLLGIAVAAYIDETIGPGDARHPDGVPIVPSWREAADCVGESLPVVLAIGHNAARDRIAQQLIASGVALQTICHPTAFVSSRATVGAGCYIGAKAIVNSDAIVGVACIVNSGACVEHHCRLENAVHLGPLSVMCGWASVGARTFVGAAASIRDRINVGADAVVGMGAVVVSDVRPGSVVVGCPARTMLPNKQV